ncbi:ribonuclease R [Planctomicrobium sp. SH661]|uniref:ribonuclease R n=1 Tax=Planctomicrobium sp. SH661 TaxID=3448124 RepID=UPI003F5BD855
MNRFRELIAEYVQRPGYKALKPKLLAKKIGVTKKKWDAFEKALEAAIAAGDLVLMPSGRILGRRPVDTHLGIVRKIASGAAYVILHEPRPEKITGDVFIEEADLLDAQSGDEVLFRLKKRTRNDGQRIGAVVEVVQRATNVFVGTYSEDDESGWVQIDGKNYSEPIWVGDPGAKGARDGDKVVVEMLRFPSLGQSGEGVLTKVLGPRGVPGVDTQLVIHEFGIPDDFPEAVLAAARLEAENFRDDDMTGREDLTDMTIVTIDPVDARDFDDAISLERWENGHWHLGVHIADVSHFVQPGTEIDREAQLRGTSVYLPTKVIPMLPEVISNGLASLQEGRVRFTVSAFMEFNNEGIRVSSRFARSAIRVKQRFAYEQVMPLIEMRQTDSTPETTPEIRQLLSDMHTLAMILRQRRFARTALELDMPEVKLDLDADGKVIGAHETEHDASHQMIEEFMLAANVAVATELNDRGLHFLRRVHQDPSLQKMTALGEFVENLGYPMKKVQSRGDLQRLLERVKGTPEEHSIHYAVLRSLKQAIYSPVEEGHYALAEANYCHFTSPIRRYPDLTIHRLLMAVLTHQKNAMGQSMEETLRLGRHCSTTERRAERAERELIKIKLLSYMETRVGEQMDAIITGVDRYGFFCRGVEIPAEGLVHISSLSRGDYFDFDRAKMALVSRSGKMFRLGDRVRVEIASVDVDRREMNFKLLEGPGKSPARRTSNRAQLNAERTPRPRSKKRPPGKSRRKGK